MASMSEGFWSHSTSFLLDIKHLWFKGLKISIFLILLIIVTFFYNIKIYSQFQNKATTFVTTTSETGDFRMPPITICMENGLKPTVMKKYDLETIFDFIIGTDSVKRYWQITTHTHKVAQEVEIKYKLFITW